MRSRRKFLITKVTTKLYRRSSVVIVVVDVGAVGSDNDALFNGCGVTCSSIVSNALLLLKSLFILQVMLLRMLILMKLGVGKHSRCWGGCNNNFLGKITDF